MTEAARELLLTFDALSPTDRAEVTAAILRRAGSTEDFSEDAMHELACELFRSYDAEEAAHGESGSG